MNLYQKFKLFYSFNNIDKLALFKSISFELLSYLKRKKLNTILNTSFKIEKFFVNYLSDHYYHKDKSKSYFITKPFYTNFLLLII